MNETPNNTAASARQPQARSRPAARGLTLIELPFETLRAVRQRQRAAFTLIELLVVVAIIALLVSILLPSVSRGRQLAKSVVCRHQLRQLAAASHLYTNNSNGRYTVAYWFSRDGDRAVSQAWDFTTTRDRSTGRTEVDPGLLWQGDGAERIQQCPSYRGGANWAQDPYTGYNYNTSYIGHGQRESIPEPARQSEVLRPAETALFGDGQYAGGANKFMRAPWKNPGDASFTGRYAGTQGFRHLDKTNVAFCDGHAEARDRRYTDTYDSDKTRIAPGTGFLSADNRLYDLE